MATFKSNSMDLEKLEKVIKYCEVASLPLNFSNKIDEGSYAHIYKSNVRNKVAAIKVLKKQFSKKKILQIAIKLRNLDNVNIVRFRGYSLRPTALCFELCEISVNGLIINNVTQLIEAFNENDHFVLNERLDIILQSSKGLQYLHGKGVVHKDFKPSNLLLSGSLSKIVIKVVIPCFINIVEI